MLGWDDALLLGLGLASAGGGLSETISAGKSSKRAKRYAKAQAAAELAAQKRREDALNEEIRQAEVPTEHQHDYRVSLGSLDRAYGNRRAELDRETAAFPGESGVLDAKRKDLDLSATRDQANLFGASDERRKERVTKLNDLLGDYGTTSLGDLSRFYQTQAENSGRSGGSALASLGSVLGNLLMAKSMMGGGVGKAATLQKPQFGLGKFGIANGGRWALNYAF